MQKITFILLLVGKIALGAQLNDVKILDVVPTKDSLKLKLHAKTQPKDGYFYLEIMKTDPKSFEKMIQVVKKMRWGDKYDLNISIPSFSPAPSGSSYRSDTVTFGGASEGASSIPAPDGDIALPAEGKSIEGSSNAPI